MADIQSTQTHPKFIWRFLALGMSSHRIIRIVATTEHEAREKCPAGCVMVFAGRLPVQEVRYVR
ncbi:host cell division inhibitor Icd-like protein [Pectobacterium versatile]|uniref:host cell division inhibitor Icd-like protein n=1 Tax=Pectobacterium versatile TaxID=2488639 RepID=UPI00301B0F89